MFSGQLKQFRFSLKTSNCGCTASFSSSAERSFTTWIGCQLHKNWLWFQQSRIVQIPEDRLENQGLHYLSAVFVPKMDRSGPRQRYNHDHQWKFGNRCHVCWKQLQQYSGTSRWNGYSLHAWENLSENSRGPGSRVWVGGF